MPDYFTYTEFRALPDCSGTTFTDAQIDSAAAYFTTIVEREVGEPFVPRTYTETFNGNGRYSLLLSVPYVRSLSSVTIGGTSVTPSSFAINNGVLRYLTYYTFSGTAPDNVVVTYTAGQYATCPADVKDAVMWATRDRLLSQSNSSAIDIRKTSVSNEFGGVTNYILPGEKRPTGYPDLDAVIASYSRNTTSLGFA